MLVSEIRVVPWRTTELFIGKYLYHPSTKSFWVLACGTESGAALETAARGERIMKREASSEIPDGTNGTAEEVRAKLEAKSLGIQMQIAQDAKTLEELYKIRADALADWIGWLPSLFTTYLPASRQFQRSGSSVPQPSIPCASTSSSLLLSAPLTLSSPNLRPLVLCLGRDVSNASGFMNLHSSVSPSPSLPSLSLVAYIWALAIRIFFSSRNCAAPISDDGKRRKKKKT